MSTPKVLDFRSDRSGYVTNDVAVITARFDQVVTVNTFENYRIPVLILSNGSRAYYVGGSGSDELRFQYVVEPSDRSSFDLTVVAVAENDATIRNAGGEDADVTVRFNDVGSRVANNDILTPSSSGDVTVTTNSLSTGADLVSPKISAMSATSGTYGVGSYLDVVVSFNEVVLVSTAGGVPTISFASSGLVLDGVAGSYISGSGTKNLKFRVEISEGMPIASALDVASVSLNGGNITDLSGNIADLTISAGSNNLAPYADIQINGSSTDTTQTGGSSTGTENDPAAFIERIQSTSGEGPFEVGDTITFKMTLSEAVTLDTRLGSPILALSNGGMAQYVSGSGSRDLLFKYTVQASDRNTQDLDIIGVAENDASILDSAGNETDVRINSTNRLANFGNVVIDAQAPYVRSIDAVDDTYIVGDVIQFMATFSEAVRIEGEPRLALSNGGFAKYVNGSGSGVLVFEYEVQESSQSSADLDVLRVNLANGTIVSAITGNDAVSAVRPGILSLGSDVEIDTQRPTGTISINTDSLIGTQTATVTVTFDEPVTDPRSAITVLNGTLSDFVTAETGDRGRVWTGTFTPALGIEKASNALVLDNTKVFDEAGNSGVGLSASDNFLIDTKGPSFVISSSVMQEDGSRLLTLDFKEPISALSSAALVVENGVKGELLQVSESVYTLSVAPETANPSGRIAVSLADDKITDALGNYNNPQTVRVVWDETAPVIEAITSATAADGTASYTTGDAIDIAVHFSELVDVNPIQTDASLNPILALSNGGVAHYLGGSGSDTLVFRYIVAQGDEATDLDVLALVENASRIQDSSLNNAFVRIEGGYNNLALGADISIDGVVPSITNVSAVDGLYKAGDEVLFDVQFSEDVEIDMSLGEPLLGLSNGAHATFVSHDGDRMVFSYQVATGDNDAQDLDVLGFAENGSSIVDVSGNRANVAIRMGINNLAERNEVNIDAARPQIADTSANAGEYKVGEEIEIALAMSKGVIVDTTQGDPSLMLNNGREAVYDAASSTATKLVFVYTILGTDVLEDAAGATFEEYDLSIDSFMYNNCEIKSLVGGADAQMYLPSTGLASEPIHIDLTLPEVVSFELSDTTLSAGEEAEVTLVLSEAVRQLDLSYFTVQHGSLSRFTTEDNITWRSTYTPIRDVQAEDVVIRLDAGRLSDGAGNLGAGIVASSSYSLDSTYPTVVIRSDVDGIAQDDVRFVVNFSEAVTGFTEAALKVVNGTIVPGSFDGPNADGEYGFMVTPLSHSTQPIKVSVGEGVAVDAAGNGNKASLVFVQPVDTDPPRIESIEGEEGAYTFGDTVRLEVRFTEDVTLELEPGLSVHELPHLSLNNGQEARYVSGSDSDVWTFEYVVSVPEDETQSVDRNTLKVLGLVENDTSLLDASGNKLEDYFVEASNQLNAGLAVDTTGAVIAGFSSVDGTYKTSDVLYIRANLSETVHIEGASPTLTLSNGGRATYLSGSGSRQLLFRYVVREGDASTADLGVASLNLGATTHLLDRAGNETDLTIVAGSTDLAGAHAIVIDTLAPELTTVRLVEDAGTLTDAVNDGYYKAGTVVAFEVDFDDDVNVDLTNGSPILTLSNGSIATYQGYAQHEVDGVLVDNSAALRFHYEVQQDDINTRQLNVTGLAEHGAKITDNAGNRAYVEVIEDQLSYTTAVVDTVAPTQKGSSDSFSENAQGEDLVRTPQTVTVTFQSNEVIGVDYTSIDYDALNAQTRDDLGLEADASQEELDAAIAQSIYAAEQTVVLSGFAVSFVGSRADANGVALTDLDSDLTAVNYRLVANADGVVDGKTFAIDVDVPDRAMGTLTVSVLEGGLEDLALNANETIFSHSQAVDTQTVDFEVTPAAGLFIGSNSEVKIYDSTGAALSAGYRLDPATGQVIISVTPSAEYPNGYRGPVLVEVIDSDESPDYIDEFTGQEVSLSDGSASYAMRAIFNVTSSGDVPVTVSPVTELSVRKLFEVAEPSEANPIDATKVDQYNSGIAKIFGLNDIVHTKATVVNSAVVEQTTGVDVADFDLSDGASESEQYGQVLAMLSARDSQSGSLASTVNELAGAIKTIEQAGQTTLAIMQAGADKLASALDSSSLDSELNSAGVNRSLLDVAYIDEANASGYGLNLAEAETTTVPIKGAKLGDKVFVQWGVITHPAEGSDEAVGDANIFEVVIDETHVAADGSIRVQVPIEVIEKQGDASEVPVSTAIIPVNEDGSYPTNEDGTEQTTVAASDYSAPVLLTVDIIPPTTTVEAPNASAPFVTVGNVEGLRGGDDLNVLLNNSADEHFKYALSTEFLEVYSEAYDVAVAGGADAANAVVVAETAIVGVLPRGLSVSNITRDVSSGTWQFDWELDLTDAISVAEEAAVAAAAEAGETYTPVPTFTADDEKAVFQVQASTADLVGNADADDARNEVIIGSVDDVVDTEDEKALMDQVLNRLSERYGDASVDTRAEIKMIAEAIDGINTLKAGVDVDTVASELVRAEQRLTLGTGGSPGSAGLVAAGVHTLEIGQQSFSVDLSASASPTVDDLIAEITSDPAYSGLPYTVQRDASGNGIDITWKAFGPQPEVSAAVDVTSTVVADQLSATISNPGGLVSFAVQQIPVDGETVDGVFVPETGDITVGFGGVDLTVSVAEGETLADALVGLKADTDYAALPFRLALNTSGDGFVATWKATQANPVTEQITVDRSYEVTTTTETAAESVVAGTAGVTAQELLSLDIQNVDESDIAAINRALASDLAIASVPVVSFDQSALAAGESSQVSMTFETRVGQVPDDALSLVGGTFSSEGDAGDPVWSSVDGLTWTANFTASSLIPNTAFSYYEELDDRGDVILDSDGNPVLVVNVADDTTDPVTYDGVANTLSQVAMTEALVNRVTAAADKVADFANVQDASHAPMPSVQDFEDMAVTGVDGTNLSAVNDALLTLRDRFETTGDLHTQINTVVESYNAVFDTVLAPAGVTQPSATDLVEDFVNLGVSNLSSDAARAEDQLTLLQGALQAIASAKSDIANEDGTTTTAADQQVSMINSVAKLESFVASVETVLARANGETVDVDGTATPIEVSADEFTALGFEDLLADTSSNSRLSSLQKVLLDQSEGTGSDAIVSYSDLKSVLEEAASSFDAIVGLSSAAQDTNYIDAAARSAAVSAALAAIDEDTFQSMGVDGVTDVAIGSLTAAAMSDAVKDALANTGNSIDSLEAIQQVVNSYTQVLSVASGDVTGADAVISDTQFADLGVSLSNADADEPADLAQLLSGVIANKAAPASGATTDNVDSIAEVQALADSAKRVFDNANQSADDGGANASQADLNVLGFDAVDADNIDAIQRVLTRTESRDGVTSYSDLKAKVDAAVDAHAALTGVVETAQGNATPDLSGLDETTFSDMGVDNVDAGNVAAMLDALSNVESAIDTAVDVQTVVDSYNVLLDLGAYDSNDPDASLPSPASATDLTNIGIELETGTENAVAELASGILASLSTDAVDTVAEAQAIVDAIDAVFANTLRSGEDDSTYTVVAAKDQLHTLGFAGVTDDNLDAVQRVLSDQTDEDDVKAYTDLKTLIEDAIVAHADILNAASTNDLAGIDAADYVAMGIDGVDDTNIASINDALINTANALSTAASVQEVADSYNHILDLRDAGTGIKLYAADFTDLGVTLKATGSEQDQQLAYLQEIVASNIGNGDITTVSGLQDLANATSDLIDLIQGNGPDSDGVEGLTVAQLALLGVTAADAEEAGMISARLARTADDLSEVTNLETDLAARVQEARDALNVITRYANEDGVDPNGDTGNSNLEFFVVDRAPYTSGSNTYDFDPNFYVRFDNINVGSSVSVRFNDGSSDITVTKTYNGDGSDQSKINFVATTLLGDAALSGIKSDALLGWDGYSTTVYDRYYSGSENGFQLLGEVGSKWMSVQLKIDDGISTNTQIANYDVNNWSGAVQTVVADPFITPTPDDFLNIGVNGYAVTEAKTHVLTLSSGSLIVDGNEATSLPSAITTTSGKTISLESAGVLNGDQYYYLNVDQTAGFSYVDDRLTWTDIDEVFADANGQGINLILPTKDQEIDAVLDDLETNAGLATGGGSWDWYATQNRQSSAPSGSDSGTDTPSVVLVRVEATSLPAPMTRVGGIYEYDLSDTSLIGETIGITIGGIPLTTGVTIEGTPGTVGSKLKFIPDSSMDLAQTFTLVTGSGVEIALPVQGKTPIDTSNIASINELFAAVDVGADEGDDPATVRSEIQYVIDQNVGRLGALAKISAYAQANVLTPADSTLIPDAADFAAAGVSGVTDANNIPALLVKLAALGSSSNAAAADTAAELQGFVKQVAIEKIKAWTDTDGGNGSAPILQDYLNADLVSYDDAAITEAMVPSLNELFAGSLTTAGDADDQTQQQGVIDGAADMLAAMAKIADYADADGTIDFTDDGVNDHLTVADFEAAGIVGVGDGTNVSTGSGTSASTYNNLEAVLSKLAQSDIAYLNADTVGEVQQLVADVAVEKINSYADADGVLGLVNETITVYVDVKTSDHPEQGGSTNAFYLDNVEAPALDLKAGTYTFDQSEPSNANHPLNIYANGDKSGTLPAGITVTQTGTPGQAGAQTVVVIDADFSGTVSYQCESHAYMGNSAEVEMPYFTPELQDYTNAGLVEDSTANPAVAINANQVPFVNALFARSDVGGTLANSDTYHADTQANQQDAIDQFGASMLALEKFVDYMLTENSVVKADFTAQDFVDAGLARVDGTNYSAILDRLPGYETSDTLVRNNLDSVEKIQAFVSRAIIAEYNADQANQAPVGDDYVAAGITGADADNAAAMNYQVANNGDYADTVAALEALVTPADAAITKLATDDLSHIDPISNDSQITIGRSHDGSSFVPHTLQLSNFGDYFDPSSDALASIKITSLPAAGVIALDGSAITAGASISVQDINDGKLTYTPTDTTGAVSLEYAVIDDQGNESAVDYTLSIDRLDASPATGIANSGLLQTDAAVYSSPVYVGDALTGFDGMSSLRVVISATGGNVKINSADLSASGASQITTGFDYATTGGDEICIEGTEAQINAALKALRTQITSGQEKVDISIDVQPGGMVYNPENGHFYEYVASSGISWTSAKTAAESLTFEGMTGYLATPTSAEENAFIASKVSAQAWIGAGDPNTEGKWEWLTGPEAGTQFWSGTSSGSAVGGEYNNWSSGEPNDSGGNEDYAHYLLSGKWNDFAVNNSSIQGYMVEYGGLSGDVPTVKSAVRTLTVYATEALGNVDMTLTDFVQAGVIGVTEYNLSSVNQVLSTKSAADTDTNPKLQAIVNDTIAAIAKIEDYNNAANGVTSLDETDYAAAGIIGVTADNVAAINTAVSALSAGGADTTSEIQAVVSQVRIEAYADATASTSPMPEAPTVADYHALGIYSVDASNISGVNTFVFDAAITLAEDKVEIALLVQEALELQPLLDAVAKISAYADADGVGVAVPTLDDYVAAQLTGVTQYNVGMANALFANANVGAGDTTSAATQSDQQSVLNAATAELASYSKIVSYADNDAGPQPTLTDYTNIGLQNFPSEYVSLINAKLVTAGIGIAEVDELSELEAMASQIKITEYANANGLAVDGTTALTGDFVPTQNDYANIGVTEIFDGAEMVAVDSTNVEQLNDLMAMRYIGNPDADGDGSTAAQGDTGERVDVVDNATDAATNETNLDYAGPVDTVAAIQDAIAKAMGDNADADSATFGLRAAALDKIAAFSQAVNGLADQAAYNAYIANSNNAAGIPTAQDYNNAGVLDLTDSTAGIIAALATAINAKLFTGGATSAVNTVTELQPFVDSANEIVNKIAAYANGTWTEGNSEIDYVDLVYTFANGDFSTGVADGEGFINAANQATTSTTGSFEGWNYIIDQVIPGVDQIGGEAITSPDQGTIEGFTYSTTVFNEGGKNGDLFGTFNTSNGEHISVDTVSTVQADGTTGSVLQLQMDIDHFKSDGTDASGGARAIYYGPAVYSQETYILSPGDRISLDWRALSGGSYGNDASAVVGYLAKVGGAQDGSDNILLVKYAAAGSTTWSSVLDGGNQYVEIGANDGGEYFFVFMAGSAETHGTTNPGTQVGSTFEIDNIKLTTATGQAPVEFNGITFEGGSVTTKAAQQVFDRGTAEGTGFVTTSASDATPAVLGWKDDGTFNKEPAVLQSIQITSSKLITVNTPSSGFDNSALPKRFVVEGWDQSQNAWVEIQSFDDDAAVSTDFSVTGQSYLEFDITSDQAFTGFRVKVYESFGGDGAIEISELDFMAKPANQTAGVLTRPDFEAIGITGVTDNNLSAINAGLFSLPDASSVSMLPGIQTHVNRVSAALQRITDFANSDGAGDTDNNFTNTGSETAVPTVADYNDIGLHFYRTADGRYHEITDENIAAINEIIALAAIGDDGGDLPAATFENVKTIFETEAYTKRLVAIEKISQVVDNSATSVTLLDDTGTPTVVENQTISLVLESVFGTETVSATIGAAGDWGWPSIATSLSLGLATNSGFTISSVSGGIKVERADGQAFSVKGSGSADDFALSVDGASPAVSIGAASSAALTGIASVAGSGVQLTVADFSDAGVSSIDGSNIEAAVQKYVAKTDSTELDTALELTAVAFPPTQTITIDGISRETGGELSRETLAVVEDYDGSFNQYVYTIDESSISVGDVFEIVVNGATLTTAPIASADKVGIVQALNAVMPQDGGSPVANVINNTGQDIFKLQINDAYNSGDTAPAISRFVAPSDFITSDDDGLTVSATLSAQLEAGQTLQYSNDDGASWIDITSSVSGTAVSYVDASLTESATIQIKVANVAADGPIAQQPIVIDTAPPIASVSSTDSSGATIQSSESGTAYLVSDTITVSTLADITGAADNLRNSVSISAEDTDTVLSYTGLNPGNYKLYTIDAAGNLSAASQVVTVEQNIRAVTVSNMALAEYASDASNGVDDAVKVLTANLSSELLPTDSVLMTINGGTPIDVTQYVNDGQLAYGEASATVTITKGTANDDGFLNYFIIVPKAGGGYEAADSIFVPTSTLVRSDGSYSFVNAPVVFADDFDGATALTVTTVPANIQSGDTLQYSMMLSGGGQSIESATGTQTFTATRDTTTYGEGDNMLFEYTVSDSTIAFSSMPTVPMGAYWVAVLSFSDGNTQQSREVIKVPVGQAITIDEPAWSTLSSLSMAVGFDMVAQNDGSFDAVIPASIQPYIGMVGQPTTLQVIGSDNVTYAMDNSLINPDYEMIIGQPSAEEIAQLSSTDTFDATVQLVGVASNYTGSVLVSGTATSVPLDVGGFVVSEDDQIVISVKNADDVDITDVATSGDDTLDVHLTNRVDFLGIDINGDGDFTDLYETAINGVVGQDDADTSTGDSEVTLYLDVSDATAGDVITIYADGVLVATSDQLTSGDISAGTYKFESDDGTPVSLFDLSTPNSNGTSTTDDHVLLGIKVVDTGGVQQQETDVTWDYQW